jgi:hypothetical protein
VAEEVIITGVDDVKVVKAGRQEPFRVTTGREELP